MKTLDEVCIAHVVHAMEELENNQAIVSRVLGITPKTVRVYLKKAEYRLVQGERIFASNEERLDHLNHPEFKVGSRRFYKERRKKGSQLFSGKEKF